MRTDKRLAASVCFLALVAVLFFEILFGLIREWRGYCQEQRHVSVDWFDCENWNIDCEDIA